MRLLALFFVFSVLGCNDRGESPLVRFGPPTIEDEDMSEMGDLGPDRPLSPSCEDVSDGEACPLENAAGICVEGRCVLVACEQGFGECNGVESDGCETPFDVVTSCGACDAICTGEESCQFGRRGHACTAGFSCPRDAFDVDGDLSNGCEIQTVWGEAITLFQVEPQAIARVDDRLLIAGTSETSRVLVDGVQNIDLTTAGAPDVDAISVGAMGQGIWSAWPDGISWVDEDVEVFWQPRCLDGEMPQIVGAVRVADRLVVASRRELYVLEECAEGLCETRRIHRANYLAAFRERAGLPAELDTFDGEEFDLCDAGCLFDATGLAVAPTCLDGACALSEGPCNGCEPAAANCPDFRPVALAASQIDPDRLYVLTARGIIALSLSDVAPLFRLEESYEPGIVSGARYASVAVEPVGSTVEWIRLLGADGVLRTLAVSGESLVEDARPIHAPARLDADPVELTGLASLSNYGIISVPSMAQALGQVGPALKAVDLVADTIPGGVVANVVGIHATASDVEVYYSSPGRLQIRRVFVAADE